MLRFLVPRHRRLWLLAAVVALFVASEPLIHTHPLTPRGSEASAVCATCATSSAQMAASSPAIGAPSVALVHLVPHSAVVSSSEPCGTLPSRAPPIV